MAEFSNPNQQGSQDNRSLVAMMVLVMAVLFGVQYYHAKTTPPPAPAVSSPAAAPPASSPVPPGPFPAASNAQPAAARPNAPAVPVVQAVAQANSVIENELYRITFSNRGAQVTSWVLKQLRNSDGKPLDLVSPEAAAAFGDPLSLYTSDPSIAARLNQAMFAPSATGLLTAPAKLTFKFSDGDLLATKTFSFDETYVMHAEVAVTRAGSPVAALISWPGGFGDQDETSNGTAYTNAQFLTNRSGTFNHIDPKKVNNGETLTGPFDFAGVSDPFFAAVFLPDSPATTDVVTLHNQLDVSKTLKRVGFSAGSTKQLDMPILGAAVGDTSGPTDTRIFVGPKLIEVLKGVHAADSKVSLEPVLEFGFWGVIGKPLFLALHFIHDHMVSGWSGSWGWSIVILTVFINILTLPFKVKTMQSALKMQRIQPQMDAIKERYKKYKVTDPKRNEMNAEIMQLQKDNGVNMFGGCIPSLITFPLLVAFFTMLPRVVELRQAHWFWLPNLQAPDPLHILPILMGLSMFLVQYYTPSPGIDPQQQKMMAFMMPAFSVYMTWTYGSGLALYWAVGNLISIAQQSVMNRTSLGREMREIAAKRARRKATTIQGRK
ncbi:MAG: membrane protein insertase YidC [Acidobacteriaceae bacterium]